MPFELNSKECVQCKSYHAVAEGLCGNCLVDTGKDPVDYDPGLVERKKKRQREMDDGSFPLDELQRLQNEAAERPPSVVAPGLTPKGPAE